jgi:cytochrome b
MFVSLLTGLLIEFGPDDLHETMETIHKLSLYYLISFIVLHFGGLWIAEKIEKQSLVSKMIASKE